MFYLYEVEVFVRSEFEVKKKIIALLKKHGAKRNMKNVGGHVVPITKIH